MGEWENGKEKRERKLCSDEPKPHLDKPNRIKEKKKLFFFFRKIPAKIRW